MTPSSQLMVSPANPARFITVKWGTAPLRVALVKPAKLADGGLTWAPEGSVEHHTFAGFDTDSDRAVNPRGVYLAQGLTYVSQTVVPVERAGVYQLIFEYEQSGKEWEDAERGLEGIASGVLKIWNYGFVIVRPSPEHAPEID